MQVLIAMPIYNDWESAMQLCQKIDSVFEAERSYSIDILLIDDGSTRQMTMADLPFSPRAIKRISLLTLRRNLGHQRAIAVGICYLSQHKKADVLVVMDADGEDRAEDIPLLLRNMPDSGGRRAVFAMRGRRVEGILFRFFYYLYLVAHRSLTGRDIRFGNFSAVPWEYVGSLTTFPELWNHYAATFVKSRLPYTRVRSDRGVRLSGRSTMNFTSLVVHGLSALFANQELVVTRVLIMNLMVIFLLLSALATVAGVRIFTHLAIPGWATMTAGILLVLISQSLVTSIVLVFSTMMNRSQLGFLPMRDYVYFVGSETPVYPV